MDDELLTRFAQHDRRALARLLTLAESGSAPLLPQQTRRALTVGITGSGGAGKSTLIAALVGMLRQRDLSVAVIACDPQSPRSGGALLGDRIRLKSDPADEGVFFRSLSTRGGQGGISPHTSNVIAWLSAFGFDFVLVETVGAGQDHCAVRDVVDRLLLLVTPHSGDEVQWEKAGVLELADVVAVNKADLPDAARVCQQLRHALSLSHHTLDVPVLEIIASQQQRLEELWTAISEGL